MQNKPVALVAEANQGIPKDPNTTVSLDGKRVVVIGGATGIGFAVAELACRLGATTVIG